MKTERATGALRPVTIGSWRKAMESSRDDEPGTNWLGRPIRCPGINFVSVWSTVVNGTRYHLTALAASGPGEPIAPTVELWEWLVAQFGLPAETAYEVVADPLHGQPMLDAWVDRLA